MNNKINIKKEVIIIKKYKMIQVLDKCINQLDSITQEEFQNKKKNGGIKIPKIKEYIFIINNEVFQVYGNDEIEAEATFIKVCQEYANTENKNYKEYWTRIASQVIEDEYICIENVDFKSVRKII